MDMMNSPVILRASEPDSYIRGQIRSPALPISEVVESWQLDNQ